MATLLFDTSSAAPCTVGSDADGSQALTLSSGITMNSTVANYQLINANVAFGASNVAITNGGNFGSAANASEA